MYIPANKLTALVVLFFLGIGMGFAPVTLHAQTADPFGEVDDAVYDNTMNITGYVRFVTMRGGQWVPVDDRVLGNETVVAVYCGDELRGKGSPADFNDKYFSLLMMTVYGENMDQLHFKVFIPDEGQTQGSAPTGRIIEVAPPELIFMADDRLGKAKEPYYLDLPAPVTTNFSAEGWATTCLPFDALVPDGVTLWNATAIEKGELAMTKLASTVGTGDGAGAQSPTGQFLLPKNTPVILKSGLAKGETCEWLSKVADTGTAGASPSFSTINPSQSILSGTTEPKSVAANSVLTLGHSNKGSHDIGFWLFNETTIPANRAYIANFPAGTRGVGLGSDDGTTTGIYDLQFDTVGESINDKTVNRDCFDLQGRKVNATANSSLSSLRKGVYVVEGKKIVIR